MSIATRWRILQIADSGFPTGGFAHSAGLEAAVHLGEVRTVTHFDAVLRAYLWNVGHASLPFVAAAHEARESTWALCDLMDACLTSHVANRASRTQGRAFLATSAEVFEESSIAELAAKARSREARSHLAPLFGATLRILGIAHLEALALHLQLALRGMTSAAVRLGVVGPLEAQRLQVRHGATLDAVLQECSVLRPEQASSVAPLLDLFGATHDAMYSRLFQS
jgi:urease accessory protein